MVEKRQGGKRKIESFHTQFIERSECQWVAIDFAYFHLTKKYAVAEDIKSCRTIKGTYDFFEKRGFCVKCYCNLLFLLNPFTLYVFVKSILKTYKKAVPDRHVAIIYSSAWELYGIDDIWTHYLCEYFQGDYGYLYDPYASFIQEDYPKLKVNRLTLESLADKKSVKFIIWR